MNTRYQFTGREFDNFTGLHFYRARWYDSNLGRFISEDPIGFAGGDVNLYGYVRNKPLMLRDPHGLVPPVVVGGLVFAGGGAVVGVVGQALSDVMSGQVSGWEDFAGSAIGGAAGGLATLAGANPFAGGAVGSATVNFSKQICKNITGKQCGIDYKSLALDTGLGFATGGLDKGANREDSKLRFYV